MDLSKLKLQCGVDTFEAVANVALENEPQGVKNVGTRPQSKQHGKQWRYKINIDKYSGEDSGYNLDMVTATIEDITKLFTAAGASELFVSRFDIRFDNFVPKTYSRYYKLNQLLLSLVAYDLKIKNRYGSIDPITGELKSMCIGKNKNNDRQAKYYNKILQKPELGITARLELRSIQRTIDLINLQNGFMQDLAAEWFDILNHAANKAIFKALKADINNNIVSNYDPNLNTGAAEFVAVNALRIYDKPQASALFAALGKAGRNGVDFFAKRPQQQIITIDDIKAYIQIIKAAADSFFSGEQMF